MVLENHESITSAVENFGDYICAETLAVKLKLADEVAGDQVERVELIDDVSLDILVELNK